MGYIDRNLLPGEKVVYRARLHWSFYLTPIAWLFAGLLLGGWVLASSPSTLRSMTCPLVPLIFVAGLIMLAASALAAQATEFAVTNRRIVAKGGVLRRRSLEILLPKVESISFSQPLLGMVFDYGTVVVVGTGGTREHFSNIANPEELRRQVHARLQSSS